ncbi:MAG: type VI secretion system-associated FHA domain protein [Erythrobacter sp.]
MYMLQLFDRDDAIEPIDARLLATGTLAMGRDPAADWSIPDPDCALSREHCTLHAEQDCLSITVTGANGVFDAITGTRLPTGERMEVALPGALRMGRFRVVATLAPQSAPGMDAGSTMILTPPLGSSIDVPSEWSDASDVEPRYDGSLLEAFCEGAGLDPSLLSDEEPEVIMRRAGALYRQMVLGIGDLMAERDHARANFEITRTTIASEGNNPFKWAPSQRLAIDLLTAGSTGFLSGPAALKASFEDVKRHLVATFAGFQGSLRAAIDSFDPTALNKAAGRRANLLKSRSTAQAEETSARHADLSDQLENAKSGSLDQAFVAAYRRAESSLTEAETL